jgi:hypothetical protein
MSGMVRVTRSRTVRVLDCTSSRRGVVGAVRVAGGYARARRVHPRHMNRHRNLAQQHHDQDQTTASGAGHGWSV